MKDQLYIPKEIRVGFQERNDTFTKKLAYVIYVDDKGVLRKEKSWNSWCSDKIEKVAYQNEPTSGFMLNKNVERYNWGHFSSNRSYIRVHDPRGFEFEISPENLIGILMDGNCNHRVLDGEFVYSWHGTDLVLLPCHSPAFKKAVGFTELQAKKLGVADFIPGHIYRTRQEKDLIFIGRFNLCDERYSRKSGKYETSTQKKFIFMNEASWLKYANNGYKVEKYGYKPRFEEMSGIQTFAEKVSDTHVDDFATLMDEYNKLPQASQVVSIVIEPRTKLEDFVSDSYYNTLAIKDQTGAYKSVSWNNHWQYHQDKLSFTPETKIKVEFRDLAVDKHGKLYTVRKKVVDKYYHSYEREEYIRKEATHTLQELLDMGIGDVRYTLANGFTTDNISVPS